MSEMTSIKVEKPVVDWLNSIKGLMEWTHGKKYTLNKALILVLAQYDLRLARNEGKLSTLSIKRQEEYMTKRLKQFWGDEKLPDIRLGKIDEFFKRKK